MDPKNDTMSAEAELESFRQRWREEVSARARGTAPASAVPAKTAAPSAGRSHATKNPAPDAASHSHARQRSLEEKDDIVPYAHEDLGEKQHGRRLDETSAQTAAIASASKEPKTALDHYEKAVERETQGNLGDSVRLYRKAFKLDDSVHEKYKAKHFPPSFFKNRPKPQAQEPVAPTTAAPKQPDPNPSNAPATVPNTAHHSLHGLSPSLQTLLADFSGLSITGEPPPTDLSPAPPCPIAAVPEEILVQILEHLAVQDVAAFVRLAQVCKRLAYLVSTEDQVWKRLSIGEEYGFAAMHYSFTCQIDGRPLGDDDEGGFVLGDSSDSEDVIPTPPSPAAITQMLVPSSYPTYRTLFYRRPRVRFNGCYISTVNYQRSGAASTMSLTWGSPIHIVTYYRYLRFLRDGTCISLLTTSEPADVVPYLYIEHMHKNHGNLPSAPMKDALLGRWRLTGPEVPEAEEGEKEGTLIIETAGATPKYFNKMVLNVSSAGRHAKNNKLTWQGYWSYNRLTDDWGEFGLKNDRAFYWSRVKSYGMSWDEGGRKDL
ncbi:hypothetical protein E8E13_008023 [Curvularia kusanoi]|uniref:F-box domain-containing protein n=1 Tax=Curvularia kusanoi TaxID=90978 RepID=A0A9P4TI42_CURKU|nr:hypothetical protein E8E13_008023 [Curvularia kusanoi]